MRGASRALPVTARYLRVSVLSTFVCLSVGVQLPVAFGANTTFATTKDKPVITRADERADVKAPVHKTHVKLHARLDHNINRYANRSSQMMGREAPDLRETGASSDLEAAADNLDVVMLVQSDDKPIDVREASDRFGRTDKKSAHADEKPANAGNNAGNGGGRDDGRDDEHDHEHHSRVVKHATSKKVKRVSERIEMSDNPSGDSGGGGEQAGTINATQTAQAGGAIKEFTLGQGSALIAHRQHVVINTQLAKVHVLPGSVAYVAQIGKTVSVYNLGDLHDGDVHVLVGTQKVAVPVGQHVVLTKESEPKFEAVNPLKRIQSRNAVSDGTMNGVTVYHAEYSPTSALDHIKQFQALLNSKRPDDRRLSERLIKTAAVLVQMRPAFGAEK